MIPPMVTALKLACEAAEAGEVPVGAVLSNDDGVVFATARNYVEQEQNPAAHAEMLVLAQAWAVRGGKFFSDCTLTVTMEPCVLCAGAIAAFRVGKLVFGAYDPKSGAVEHGPRVFSHATTHHKPEIVGGVREAECSALLKAFFASKR